MLALTQFIFLCTIHYKLHHSGQEYFWIPFGNCLPGTELLQSPLRAEFSVGSLSWQYRWFLQSYRQSLRSYHRSLRRSVAVRCRSLHDSLNIVKHLETLVKQWYIVKQREPLLKHHEPLVKHHEILIKHCETWNTRHLIRQYRRSMWRHRHSAIAVLV